jgi:ribonuclease HI
MSEHIRTMLDKEVRINHATNNYNELTALKLVLILALEKGISQIQVLGDSLLVIQWIKGDSVLRTSFFSHYFKTSRTYNLLFLTLLLHMNTGTKTLKLIGCPRRA